MNRNTGHFDGVQVREKLHPFGKTGGKLRRFELGLQLRPQSRKLFDIPL